MHIGRIPSPKTEVYVITLISKINYQANISKQTFVLKISAHFLTLQHTCLLFYFIFQQFKILQHRLYLGFLETCVFKNSIMLSVFNVDSIQFKSYKILWMALLWDVLSNALLKSRRRYRYLPHSESTAVLDLILVNVMKPILEAHWL